MTPIHVRNRMLSVARTLAGALFALVAARTRGAFRIAGIASAAIVLLACVTVGSASANSSAPGNHAKNEIFNVALTAFCSLPGNVYRINNLNSRLSLEVHGASTLDGANVDQWGWTGGTNEKWCRIPLAFDSTSFYYENIKSQKCLEVHGASKSKGANVDQWDCISGATNELWIDAGGTVFAANSYLCLDMQGGSTSDGGNAEVWDCNGRSNQTWLMYSGY
jgi:Ricin-type beta-trefoil lectin domain